MKKPKKEKIDEFWETVRLSLYHLRNYKALHFLMPCDFQRDKNQCYLFKLEFNADVCSGKKEERAVELKKMRSTRKSMINAHNLTSKILFSFLFVEIFLACPLSYTCINIWGYQNDYLLILPISSFFFSFFQTTIYVQHLLYAIWVWYGVTIV